MNVLALCDGMSCGQLALKKLGIHVDNYFASEIDKYARRQTRHTFPDTIQLGGVRSWTEWDLPKIDLILMGPPCQGFSFAGKQLNFSDPRSALFFVCHQILEYYNPKYFLMENVVMKEVFSDIISEHLGVPYIKINSARVSAQTRKRLYWTNIGLNLFGEPSIRQPNDKGIHLKDILEPECDVPKKCYTQFRNNKKLTTGSVLKYDKLGNKKLNQNKASCFTAGGHSAGNHSDMDVLCVAVRGRYLSDGCKTEQCLEPNLTGKTNTLTTVAKDNLLFTKNYLQYDVSGKGYKSQQDRAYYKDGKHGTLASSGNTTGVLLDDYRLRRLTVRECCRLQTVPEDYEWVVSDSQAYKMLGNGWTVDVIAHILKQMK